MRKAVAVPYVIALILGVAVIGLVGVWLVMSGGKFTKSSFENDCRVALTKACSTGIANGIASITITYPTGCTDLGFETSMTLAECKTALGIS